MVVPAYIAAGALLKLLAGSPADLPASIIRLTSTTNGVPDWAAAGRVHAALIAVEMAAAGMMVAGGRAARAAALAVLGAFCAVLLVEVAQGGTACGCFGSVRLPVGLMLTIDLALLTLVMLLPITECAGAGRSVAMPVIGAGAGLLFAGVLQGLGAAGVWRADAGGVELDAHTWQGKPWEQLTIAPLLKASYRDFPEPVQRWVIYARTCPSCRLYFEENPPREGERVVAVEVPPPPTIAVEPPPGATGRPPPPRAPATPDIECAACVRVSFPPEHQVRALSLPIILHVERGRVTRVEQPAH